MKKLFLEKFKCREDNDGDGSDSPYFLVFVGRKGTPGSAFVHAVYLKSLDDTVAPNPFGVTIHKEVAGQVDSDSTVIVALLERDEGIDLTGQEFDQIQSWMRNKFAEYSKDGTVSAAELPGRMRRAFRNTINANTNNDDLIGIRSVPIPVTGQPPVLEIANDPESGRYEVGFQLQ